MKKTLASILAIFLALSLFTACSKQSTETPTTETAPSVSDTEATTEAPKSEVGKPKTFVDNVITADMCSIKITDYKVIQPGEEFNEGDKPIIAFWYDVTSKTDEAFTSNIFWISLVDAIQDNDPNVVNDLEVSTDFYDESLPENRFDNIKNGGTVSNAIAYELTDLETPVILRAGAAATGEVYGEQTYQVK